jgi:hypothetical protein
LLGTGQGRWRRRNRWRKRRNRTGLLQRLFDHCGLGQKE